MIRFFKTPILHRFIFYRRVWGFSNTRAVFLTFDDGPSEDLTQWILDFLKKEEIKATFFCVGENVQKHPELLERIKIDGHAIGNHTMGHENGLKTSKKRYLASIEEANTVVNSNLFRPPYGRMWFSYSKAIRKKYQIIMWSWLSYDFATSLSTGSILQKAKKQIKGGDIIVLHDNPKVKDRLKELLPELIRIIREKELNFDVIRK
tara:strand:- start:53642 stop:54256 length:615 start_codon:yes stop_codon:yes gene_type:complete